MFAMSFLVPVSCYPVFCCLFLKMLCRHASDSGEKTDRVCRWSNCFKKPAKFKGLCGRDSVMR
jgi:hypothetical protein